MMSEKKLQLPTENLGFGYFLGQNLPYLTAGAYGSWQNLQFVNPEADWKLKVQALLSGFALGVIGLRLAVSENPVGAVPGVAILAGLGVGPSIKAFIDEAVHSYEVRNKEVHAQIEDLDGKIKELIEDIREIEKESIPEAVKLRLIEEKRQEIARLQEIRSNTFNEFNIVNRSILENLWKTLQENSEIYWREILNVLGGPKVV